MRTIVTTLLSIIFIGISFVGNSIAGEVLDNIRKTNKMILFEILDFLQVPIPASNARFCPWCRSVD